MNMNMNSVSSFVCMCLVCIVCLACFTVLYKYKHSLFKVELYTDTDTDTDAYVEEQVKLLPKGMSRSLFLNNIFNSMDVTKFIIFQTLSESGEKNVWDIRILLKDGSSYTTSYRPTNCSSTSDEFIWENLKPESIGLKSIYDETTSFGDKTIKINSKSVNGTDVLNNIVKFPELPSYVLDKHLLHLTGELVEKNDVPALVERFLNSMESIKTPISKFKVVSTRSSSVPPIFKGKPLGASEIIVYRDGAEHGKVVKVLHDEKNRRILVAMVVAIVQDVDIINYMVLKNGVGSAEPTPVSVGSVTGTGVGVGTTANTLRTDAQVLLEDGIMQKNDFLETNMYDDLANIKKILCTREKSLVDDRGFFYLKESSNSC